ncbi:MAG TPA: LCP family protein [Patescibacteria group bacterium]|nr:LCP family protein [Patescibacteria group bacterium]
MKNFNTKRLKRFIFAHIQLTRFVILGAFFVLIIGSLLFLFKTVSNSVLGEELVAAKNFILPDTQNKRINILLMGVRGESGDGPDLTDTMILVSINTQNKKMALISIPRDIWVDDLKDKVNSAYMYGKQKGGAQTGIILAKSTIEEITGQQIDYGVVVDFSSFKDIVDAIGGVQVNVANSFTDTQYPVAGQENNPCISCRYMTVSFQKGLQTMNGDTALEFVRSRHASGVEGNDIAREARQQLIIDAILKKIVTPQVLTNTSIDEKLFNVLRNNILTDMTLKNAGSVARYIIDAKNNKISYTIPDDLLYTPSNEYLYHNQFFTHAFVFIPNNKKSISGSEDWSDIQKWVSSVLN